MILDPSHLFFFRAFTSEDPGSLPIGLTLGRVSFFSQSKPSFLLATDGSIKECSWLSRIFLVLARVLESDCLHLVLREGKMIFRH